MGLSLTSFVTNLANIVWNPPKEAFVIPYFDLAVMWYGIFFALGFIIGYFIFIQVINLYFKNGREFSTKFADKIVWAIVLGTIIGARLGHVFFYDFPYYLHNPLEILMIRKGGLASHGGTIGIMIALFIFLKINKKLYPNLNYIRLIDLVCIPTAFAAFCIRIGNFFNQEIIGTASNLPWAIIFANPAEDQSIIPRHPAQIYEALIYLFTFIFLFSLWRITKGKIKTGVISGLFFIFVFGSRFFIEFVKVEQTFQWTNNWLHIGQLLSIPFVALGVVLLLLPNNKSLA